MGHVIPFPLASQLYPDAAYPEFAAELDTAEGVLLLAIRWWVRSYRDGEDPIPRLCQGFEAAGAPDSAGAVDRLMSALARSATRPIDVHCPRCEHLSVDEQDLLRAASLVQANRTELAEKVLRTSLLSADGAASAIGPLGELGELFAQARLLLSRRRWRSETPAVEVINGAWIPPRSVH